MRLIIVSGLSGSGKSVALQMLEDLNFYCIDNIPAGLLDSFVSQITLTKDPFYSQTAVGVDARNRPQDIMSVPELVEKLRSKQLHCEVVFLHADDNILLKRYSETRRKHPLSNANFSLREAISYERKLLTPIVDVADLVIDTTRTSVPELREIFRKRIAEREQGRLSILIESFGFKHGIPSDADFVFDARCLPNPYWEPSLRSFSGRDAPVIEFLESQEGVKTMLEDIAQFLEKWIPHYEKSDRNYLTVAIGCTGGQHRSVYLVDKLAERISRSKNNVLTRHNELPSPSADLFQS